MSDFIDKISRKISDESLRESERLAKEGQPFLQRYTEAVNILKREVKYLQFFSEHHEERGLFTKRYEKVRTPVDHTITESGSFYEIVHLRSGEMKLTLTHFEGITDVEYTVSLYYYTQWGTTPGGNSAEEIAERILTEMLKRGHCEKRA